MASFGSEGPLELTVSGKPFLLSRALASKYPFSRFADLMYEIPRGGRHALNLDVNAFAAVLHYLEQGDLNEAQIASTQELQRTFQALNIPSPLLNPPEHHQTREHPSPNPTMNDKTSSIDPLPPAYEEISHQGVGSAREEPSNPSAGSKASEFDPTLPTQLALVREQRITSLIYTYILPLIAEQGFSGLYRTSCVLVPSNVLMPADSSSAADVIIGFPENEDIRLIRLSGEDNKLEFWRQDAVVAELEAKLKEALFSKGHRLASDEDALPTSIPSPVVEPSNSARNPSKASWFRRRTDSKDVSAQDPTSNSKAGWRAPEEASQLKFGEIRVKVTLEDICLRVVSAMGLYDTRTGKAIIVRVHVADSHYL